MRSSLAPLVASGLLLFGCATPSTPSNQTGSAGSSQSGTAGNSSSGSAGTSGTGNTTGSGTGNTTGSGTGNTTGSGTAAPARPAPAAAARPASPTRRTSVRTGGWICDAHAPVHDPGLLVRLWRRHVAAPMCTPAANPCTGGRLLHDGRDDRRTTYSGVGLRHRHGAVVVGRHEPDQERLRGPGEVLQHHAHRQQRRQPGPHRVLAEPDAGRERRLAVQGDPGVHQRLDGPGLLRRRHLPELGGHGRHRAPRRRGDGTPVDMQIQIPGGDRAGAFNVCITKVEPVASGSTGTGGSGGGTNAAAPRRAGRARSRRSTATRTSCARRSTSSRTTPGARPPARRSRSAPATKFKVTVQNENRHRQQHARRLPVDLDGRVQQPQHAPAAACPARSARSPRAACRPA